MSDPGPHRPDGPVAESVAELLEKASAVVDEHVDRSTAARSLVAVAGGDRSILERAHLEHLRRMHRLPSDDLHATAVLRVLEQAITLLPRSRHHDEAPERRRRWSLSRWRTSRG